MATTEGVEALRVAVRVRPFSAREQARKSELAVTMSGPNTLVVVQAPPGTGPGLVGEGLLLEA